MSLESSPESLTKAQKVFTMVGALLGLLLAALDQTIVATAGPKIQVDLAIEPSLYVWITTAYLVASTVLVPVYGKVSDLYGRRRILLAAIMIFLLGSLLCGVSQSATQLIAARAVQGAGSAGLFTSAFAVVADLFPPAERSKYQGVFGAAFGLSSVVGPLMGGFITDNFGWHWTFFVNLPIGLVAIALIIARMPPLKSVHAVRPKLDLAGAVTLAVATLPLLLALSLGRAADDVTRGGWPWLSWQILALFGVGALGAIAFVMVERRVASPILDLGLFRTKTFAVGSVAAFVVGGAFLGAIVFLPLFMVNVIGLSATDAGLTTTPLTFGIVFANITSGQLVAKLGAYKGILLASLAIMIAGFAILAVTLDPAASQLGVSAKMVVLGIGLGPSIPLFTLAIQNAVPPQRIGVATAAATFFRQMGSTVGIAVVGTVFATALAGALAGEMAEATRDVPPAFKAQLAERSPPAPGETAQKMFDADRIKHAIDTRIDAGPTPATDRPAAKAAAHATVDRMEAGFKRAFTHAMVRVFWLSLVIGIVGLLSTAFLPQLPLRRGPVNRPPPE